MGVEFGFGNIFDVKGANWKQYLVLLYVILLQLYIFVLNDICMLRFELKN